jgi:hypothetical protein
MKPLANNKKRTKNWFPLSWRLHPLCAQNAKKQKKKKRNFQKTEPQREKEEDDKKQRHRERYVQFGGGNC